MIMNAILVSSVTQALVYPCQDLMDFVMLPKNVDLEQLVIIKLVLNMDLFLLVLLLMWLKLIFQTFKIFISVRLKIKLLISQAFIFVNLSGHMASTWLSSKILQAIMYVPGDLRRHSHHLKWIMEINVCTIWLYLHLLSISPLTKLSTTLPPVVSIKNQVLFVLCFEAIVQ